MGRNVARMELSRNAYRILMGKPERKTRRRGEDIIKMNLMEVGCDPGDWIDLAEDRDQCRACKGGNEPPGSLKAS